MTTQADCLQAAATSVREADERSRDARAIGGKLMGAGGGGYLLVAPETGNPPVVTHARPSTGGYTADVDVDLAGLQARSTRCP